MENNKNLIENNKKSSKCQVKMSGEIRLLITSYYVKN